MSSLAFLSKKSWHTGLQTNQERVWKAEKAALAERRKVDELRKERDRERDLQELEQLQEQAGGGKGKRQERVDWMYNAPAGSSNIDKNELEDYLLGKKRVDKLLQGDEKSSLSRQGAAGAASSSGPSQAGPSSDPTGLSGIQSDRDVSSKIRQDPMLAIRQEEQAAYQALLKDPARLRAMRKSAGLPDKETESKEDRRRRREEKRRRREREDVDDRRERRHRSPMRSPEQDDHYHRRSARRYDDDNGASRWSHREDRYGDRNARRPHSPDRSPNNRFQARSRNRESDRTDRYHGDDRDRRYRQDRHSERSPEVRRYQDDDRRAPYQPRRRSRSRSPERYSRSRQQDKSDVRPGDSGDPGADRAAKLAAMQQNANDLTSSRKAYLDKVQADEAAEVARDDALRAAALASRRTKGSSGNSDPKGSFMLDQEAKLYGSGNGMDLAERLRRGRDGLQRFRED